MTATSLPAALRAAAEGFYALEAATGLIIAHGTWLDRDDFACFIHHGPDTAAIDWGAAIAALDAGGLPSSAGEKRMLRLAASLADQAHVSLGDAITGIDERTTSILIKSVRHVVMFARREVTAHAPSAVTASSFWRCCWSRVPTAPAVDPR